MTDQLQNDIRERLARYLAGETSLDEFEAWFVPRVWQAQVTSRETRELIHSIDLLLAELTSGHLHASELADELRRLLATYKTGGTVQTGSSARSVKPAQLRHRSVWVDIRPATAPV
jgi:hypothetical protein